MSTEVTPGRLIPRRIQSHMYSSVFIGFWHSMAGAVSTNVISIHSIAFLNDFKFERFPSLYDPHVRL
jgi:hypothetical protein